ncbi:MAG: VTT domain-containing protein [Candidatus Solibacter sp.]
MKTWLKISLVLLAVVLIPFFLLETSVEAWIDRVVTPHASPAVLAAAIFALLAADSLLPVPSTIVTTAAGAWLGLSYGILVSSAGMSVGCIIAYACGRKFGPPLFHKMVGARDMEEVAERFRKGAPWALITMRAVPVLAEASAMFAGISAVPFGRFMAVTTLSNVAISAVYCFVGAHALNAGSFLIAFAGSIALPGLLMLLGNHTRFAGLQSGAARWLRFGREP